MEVPSQSSALLSDGVETVPLPSKRGESPATSRPASETRIGVEAMPKRNPDGLPRMRSSGVATSALNSTGSPRHFADPRPLKLSVAAGQSMVSAASVSSWRLVVRRSS